MPGKTLGYKRSYRAGFLVRSPIAGFRGTEGLGPERPGAGLAVQGSSLDRHGDTVTASPLSAGPFFMNLLFRTELTPPKCPAKIFSIRWVADGIEY
jgi:hypothetical protein